MENIGTIELEKGEYFTAINEKTNTVYVANNHSDSILVIDGSAKKIVNKISIERPRELVINSDNNTLYAISGKAGWRLRQGLGKKISIINLTTNQITGLIGEKEGFGNIKLNQKTKLLYATQFNSKKVWVIDTLTNTVKEKINVGAKYRSIAIDEINNIIYLAGREGFSEKLSYALIRGNDNHTEKMDSKIGFRSNTIWELYYNQNNNKLYAFVETMPVGDGNPTVSIQVFDINSKSFGEKTESRFWGNGMGFDQSKNRFYFSDVQNGEFSVLNDSLEEIGLFRFTKEKGFVEKHLKGHNLHSKIAINPNGGLIYIAGSKMSLLHIIKE
ncbi:MAG: YncE family protein [Nitrosopumilus sp.]|nr:YncE family protein [Nitrosopumilus sp.]